jgi:hypothetical protein
MKSLIGIALGLALALTMSCKARTATYLARPDVRLVAIAVSEGETPGNYKLDPPLPDPLYLRPGQKVNWTIINNAKSVQITSLTISEFATGDKAHHDPFEGGPDDQRFTVMNVPAGSEKSTLSRPARPLPPGAPNLDYKYKITVALSSGGKPIELDPRIIIGN